MSPAQKAWMTRRANAQAIASFAPSKMRPPTVAIVDRAPRPLRWNKGRKVTTKMFGTFAEWMAKVDGLIEATHGVTTADLIDHLYEDWFDDGLSPIAAAKKAIRLETSSGRDDD